MIRKLESGQYRIPSREIDPERGRRRDLGTFDGMCATRTHEGQIARFERH